LVVKSTGKKSIMEQKTLDICSEDQVRVMSDEDLTRARDDIYANAKECPPAHLQECVERAKRLVMMEKTRRSWAPLEETG
jgi:hypothetical protein